MACRSTLLALWLDLLWRLSLMALASWTNSFSAGLDLAVTSACLGVNLERSRAAAGLQCSSGLRVRPLGRAWTLEVRGQIRSEETYQGGATEQNCQENSHSELTEAFCLHGQYLSSILIFRRESVVVKLPELSTSLGNLQRKIRT